jgi:hypothetical protein
MVGSGSVVCFVAIRVLNGASRVIAVVESPVDDDVGEMRVGEYRARDECEAESKQD